MMKRRRYVVSFTVEGQRAASVKLFVMTMMALRQPDTMVVNVPSIRVKRKATRP